MINSKKILKQSVSYQIISCKFHKQIGTDFSLIEIWIIRFSNKGDKLASVAKNYSLVFWDFNLETYTATMKIHTKDIQCLAWSPNDNQLITASADHTVKIWEPKTGILLHTLKGHSEIVSAAVFSSDSKMLYTGGIDNFILIWNNNAEKQGQIKSNRITDLLILNNNKILLAVCASYHKINLIDIDKKKEIKSIEEKDVIVSAALSHDNTLLLINTSYKNPELHIWKISNIDNIQLVNKFEGHTQEKFMLRCAFGGINDLVVSCGSEDGKIYLWHRNISKANTVLNGHTMPVNVLHWNPKNPSILASGSDDYLIKLWVSESIYMQNNLDNRIIDVEEEGINQSNMSLSRDQPLDELCKLKSKLF